MGLQGMINDLVERSDYPVGDKLTNEVEQSKESYGNCELFLQQRIFPEIAKPAMRLFTK
jgi:methylmalonyl-CoA mutase